MTLLDWAFIFVGAAIPWAIPSPFQGPPVPGGVVLLALLLTATMFLCLPFAVALVVLVRQAKYRRTIRPAEWFSFVLVAVALSGTVPNLDTALARVHDAIGSSTDLNWSLWRWSVAWGGMLIAVAGIVGLRMVRKRCPDWLRTALLTAMLVLLLWSPVDVFSRTFEFPFAPYPSRPLALAFHLQLLAAVRGLPIGFLFTVPLISAFMSWKQGRRNWIWTEWASSIAGVLATVVLAIIWSTGLVPSSRFEIVAATAVLPVYLAILVFFSHLALSRIR